MKPLNPVMAALLAASSAALALPRISHATTPEGLGLTKPSGSAVSTPVLSPVKPLIACPPAATETNPVNILSCLIAQSADARKDVGDRFARFVLCKNPSEHCYVAPELLADQKLLPGIEGQAKAWPEANKDDPAKIATLYLVMGPDGALPAWVQGTVLAKTFKPGMPWSARLQDKLAAANKQDPLLISQSGAEKGGTRFLNQAADAAQKVLDEKRTKKEISDSIAANDTTGSLPPVATQPTTNPMDGTGSGFNFSDLYGQVGDHGANGAEVANVYGPKDASSGYRTLSMKIYSSRDATTGQLINKIGIVDITGGNPSVPQFVPFTPTGDDGAPIVFRDGGRKYTITIGAPPQSSIVLKRADAEDNVGALVTSLSTLSADRDQQIARSGTVTFGGQQYHVLGQGGTSGSVMFFPVGAAPSLGGQRPVLMGDVTQVLPDGSTGPVSHSDGTEAKPNLGSLAPVGGAWHLEFDRNLKLWKVVMGQGDADKPKDDPKSKTGTQAPGQSSGTTTSPASDAAAPAPAADAGPLSLDDAIAAAEMDNADKSKVWAEDAGNAGFSADAKSKLRIMSNVQKGVKNFRVLFDPSMNVTGNSMQFRSVNGAIVMKVVRGYQDYIAMEYSNGDSTEYDIANFALVAQHMLHQASTADNPIPDADSTAEIAGTVIGANKQLKDVTNVDVAADLLVHMMGVKAGDPMLQTIRARVAKHANGKGYTINGGLAETITLGVGENIWTIWPNDIASGDKSTNEGLTNLRGPGTAVALTGSVATDFPDEMDMGGTHKATKMKLDGDHIALYSGTEDEMVGEKVNKDTKVWYVLIGYKQNGQDSRSAALAVFGGAGRISLPSGLHMHGLADVDAPMATQLMLTYGSSQEKGSIVAYQTLPDAQGGSNVKDKSGNCLGTVLWWGVGDARPACPKDGKLK